jgi:hypothetical protein
MFSFSSQNASWQGDPSAPPCERIKLSAFPAPIEMEVWDSSDAIGISFSPDS